MGSILARNGGLEQVVKEQGDPGNSEGAVQLNAHN